MLKEQFNETPESYFERRQVSDSILTHRDLRAQVWDKTCGYCWYCGTRLNPFSNFTIDHVTAVRNGGSNTLSNLVPSCMSCNYRKGTGTTERLRRALGHDQCGTKWSFERVKYFLALGLYAIEPHPARVFRFYGEVYGQRNTR